MVEKLIKAIEEYVKKINNQGYDDTFEDVCQAIIDHLKEDA